MAIPQDLQLLITQFLDYIDRDPNHRLNLGRREMIYSHFGPYLYSEDNTDNSGYIRRVVLALLSVEYVLSIWTQAWPNDNTVREIINKIRTTMSSPVNDPGELEEDWQKYWEYTTELTDSTRNIAGVVGMAASSAYGLAISDGFMSDDDMDIDREDSDDFMFNDVHFYAASVYADGPPYPIALSDRFNAQKNHAFWKWWLEQAVPAAWDTFPANKNT